MWKKIFMVLGALLLVVVTYVAHIAYGYYINCRPDIGESELYSQRNDCQKECGLFVDEGINEFISKGWNLEVLLKYSSQELSSNLKQDTNNYSEMLSAFRKKFGRLKKYNGSEMRNFEIFCWSNGIRSTTAVFIARAEFEAGSANIIVNLIKKDGRWWFNGIHLDE